MVDVVPTELKNWRACKVCGLIKTFSSFVQNGCDNCPYLQLEQDADKVNKVTSHAFHGTVGVMRPRDSWVAQWLFIGEKSVPGLYAAAVYGRLPPEVIDELADNNVDYVNREALHKKM
mmetsp:Transcript_32704/g.80103  ORF Transcript_32704/g.80103 Transcript_32704/m.80103 type:complete len:118 (-) Transcript_32704:35-388(-)